METLRSDFHAQLASVMNSVLASAVCEIAKIFESNLSQHQAALLQKTNEISDLKAELMQVQRGCTEKSTQSHTDDQPTLKSENSMDLSDEVQPLCQNFSGIKKEPQSLEEEAKSKPEQNGSHSRDTPTATKSTHVQLKQPMESFSPVQCKEEMPDWNENIHPSAQSDKEVAPPLLSISPKVCPNTNQTDGCVPELSYTQEALMENFTAHESNCHVSVNRRTAFGVNECSEDKYGTLLEQELEKPSSSNDNVQSVQREECSPFGSRDQPQSNFHTFLLPNSSSHGPAGRGDDRPPYTCPYCGMCFTLPSHQKRHCLRHTGLRLHPCQQCEKSFLTHSELTVHTRTHTGEKPFRCGQCYKRFTRSENLLAHQRDVHLGKRPFTCTECGKSFAHKGNLRVHNHRMHNGLLMSAADSHRL